MKISVGDLRRMIGEAVRRSKELSYQDAVTKFPVAIKQLRMSERSYERTDLRLYVYAGELYVESHDEQTLFVFRNDQWVELNFDKRPR